MREEKKRVKDLERELARKDKALAETAALLILRKKTSANLDFYLTAVARLGGYLARRHDPPPGTIILWRGFSRLADRVIGLEAALGPDDKTCG